MLIFSFRWDENAIELAMSWTPGETGLQQDLYQIGTRMTVPNYVLFFSAVHSRFENCL